MFILCTMQIVRCVNSIEYLTYLTARFNRDPMKFIILMPDEIFIFFDERFGFYKFEQCFVKKSMV